MSRDQFEPYNLLDPNEPSYINPTAPNDDLSADFHSSDQKVNSSYRRKEVNPEKYGA